MISRGVKLAVAVALCACIAGPFSFGNALSVDLKPNSEECVYIRSPGNSGEGGQNMLSGTFEVTAGGFLDINAAVYTPQGKRSVQAGEANVRAV